jgi:heme exporter protein B
VAFQVGISTVLAFIVSSLMIIFFSLRADQLSLEVLSGLIWIVILFASMITLSRVFISESERGTLDLLRLNSSASSVYVGKLAYNFLLTLLIAGVTVFLFMFLVNMSTDFPVYLLGIILLGAAGLAGATTLLGALVSQASRKGAVFPALALPVLVPLIIVLVRATQAVFSPVADQSILNDLVTIAGFTGVTISASIVLFDNLWED